jgi:hypothetical protein
MDVEQGEAAARFEWSAVQRPKMISQSKSFVELELRRTLATSLAEDATIQAKASELRIPVLFEERVEHVPFRLN